MSWISKNKNAAWITGNKKLSEFLRRVTSERICRDHPLTMTLTLIVSLALTAAAPTRRVIEAAAAAATSPAGPQLAAEEGIKEKEKVKKRVRDETKRDVAQRGIRQNRVAPRRTRGNKTA